MSGRTFISATDYKYDPKPKRYGPGAHFAGEVTIRDLVLGAELAASTKDRADYLELRQRAQFAVPQTGLVEAVREVLSRHHG